MKDELTEEEKAINKPLKKKSNLVHLHIYINREDKETLQQMSTHHGDMSYIIRTVLNNYCSTIRNKMPKIGDSK